MLSIASVVAWILVTAVARLVRGRLFGTFAGVMLGIHTAIFLGVAPLFGRALAPFLWLHATVYVHFLLLARPPRVGMRPLAFRALVSVPGSFFFAGTFLAMPWAIAAAFGLPLPGIVAPYALAGLGLLQSLLAREEEVDLVLGGPPVDGVRFHPEGLDATPERHDLRPLRIVQISDPHLGPFMSVARLRRICVRAVAREPDLVVLTGDFLTMESRSDAGPLTEALAPLRALRGRVFACFGNHDHEAPEVVREALAANDVRLLVDDEALVETDAGPVQIVGMDYHFRDRAARMAEVCARFPRREGHLRLILLHDPWAFRHLPHGESDLVLSGHTHGGQVGLLSVGASWTFLRLFGRELPDHGLWARGMDRLYVHRGTGHYGFPLRLGVPSEESLLRVHRARP